jgi:hypothetical protein
VAGLSSAAEGTDDVVADGADDIAAGGAEDDSTGVLKKHIAALDSAAVAEVVGLEATAITRR